MFERATNERNEKWQKFHRKTHRKISERTFLLMRILIKAKCPQSICILVQISGERSTILLKLTWLHCPARMIYARPVNTEIFCGFLSRRSFKTNQKYFFRFMGHKMRLRWNTEASYFRCWMRSTRVCSCVHAHMKQNEPSAFYVFEVSILCPNINFTIF